MYMGELGFTTTMVSNCTQFFFFFFGHALGMWQFPDQGSNPSHSSDLSHCSDHLGSLTCCAIRELCYSTVITTYGCNGKLPSGMLLQASVPTTGSVPTREFMMSRRWGTNDKYPPPEVPP